MPKSIRSGRFGKIKPICNEIKIAPESLVDQTRYVLTHQIAKEARETGFEAILAPSSTGAGFIFAIFTDRLDPRSKIEIVDLKKTRHKIRRQRKGSSKSRKIPVVR